MGRRVAVIVLVLVITLAAPVDAGTGSGPIGETPQQPRNDDNTTTSVTPLPGGEIIPEPDTGQAPADAGDRGGGLQIALLVAILAGMGAIAALVARESRRSKQRSSSS